MTYGMAKLKEARDCLKKICLNIFTIKGWISQLKKKIIISISKRETEKEGLQHNQPRGREEKPVNTQELKKQYLTLLRETAELLEKNSIPLVVVHIPSAAYLNAGVDQIPDDLWAARKVSAEMNVPIIELFEIYQDRGEPDSIYLLMKNPETKMYFGNGHFSRYGAAITGQAVATWLIEHGLLKSMDN